MLGKWLSALARDFFRLVHTPSPTATYTKALSSFSGPRSSVQSKCGNNSSHNNDKTNSKYKVFKGCTMVRGLPGGSHAYWVGAAAPASFWVARNLMAWVRITNNTQTDIFIWTEDGFVLSLKKEREKQTSAAIFWILKYLYGGLIDYASCAHITITMSVLIRGYSNWQSKTTNK